jgi:hypothetical protein
MHWYPVRNVSRRLTAMTSNLVMEEYDNLEPNITECLLGGSYHAIFERHSSASRPMIERSLLKHVRALPEPL